MAETSSHAQEKAPESTSHHTYLSFGSLPWFHYLDDPEDEASSTAGSARTNPAAQDETAPSTPAISAAALCSNAGIGTGISHSKKAPATLTLDTTPATATAPSLTPANSDSDDRRKYLTARLRARQALDRAQPPVPSELDVAYSMSRTLRGAVRRERGGAHHYLQEARHDRNDNNDTVWHVEEMWAEDSGDGVGGGGDWEVDHDAMTAERAWRDELAARERRLRRRRGGGVMGCFWRLFGFSRPEEEEDDDDDEQWGGREDEAAFETELAKWERKQKRIREEEKRREEAERRREKEAERRWKERQEEERRQRWRDYVDWREDVAVQRRPDGSFAFGDTMYILAMGGRGPVL